MFGNEIERLKSLYFSETNTKKKQEFRNQINQLINNLTNNNESFDFEVYFSEVFHEKGGFDVVIANPPYGFHQIHKDNLKHFLKENYIVAHRSYEHYFLFYELSLKLLNSLGSHAFITPVTWLTIPSAYSLRQFILSSVVSQRKIYNDLATIDCKEIIEP
jgi:predicted RNA methylase